jgi:flagella basal body P-ring formation protein FlgA
MDLKYAQAGPSGAWSFRSELVREKAWSWLATALLGLGAISSAVPLSAGTANPSEKPQFTDPAAIDRLVEAFTGHSAGTAGGARHLMDRRLKLAVCTQALEAQWHGRAGHTVAVRCTDAGGWQLFIALSALPKAQRPQKLIKRGETLVIAIRGDGFSIQQQGEALEAGTQGEWIAVRTARFRDPLQAQVVRPGLAIVALD